MTRVAILGTGLIGGSIGLGLRERMPKGSMHVVGFDLNGDRIRTAERVGAIDERARDPRVAVRDAALVVLATPLLAVRELMELIGDVLEPGTIVTDVGSTKAEVLRWADRFIPEEINFIGGHPMAGKTEVGAAHAEASLFEGARWVLVPRKDATPEAVEAIAGMAVGLGAEPMFMDAEEHDAYVAAVSHLPMLAAGALFRLAHDSEAWPEMSLLAASGFRDTTRLGGTDEQMAHDIALTNRDQLIHWLQRYRSQLYAIEDMLQDPERDEELLRWFTQQNVDYIAFKDGEIGRTEVHQKSGLPEIGVTDVLMGGALADRLRQITDRAREMEDGERSRGR